MIATKKLPQAYDHLVHAIASGDNEDELSYSLIEQDTVTPLLRDYMTQDMEMEVRTIDYAYYLLIHHYKDFVQAGITPEKTREEYLSAYAEGIEQRKGQESMEKQDEIAKFLLDSLQQHKAA